MQLLIGTNEGLFSAGSSGSPAATDELAGRCVRTIRQVNGDLFGGADDGVYRSRDGGKSWRLCGAEGRTVWEIAAAPRDGRNLFAGTQPTALFHSEDSGDSWQEVESLVGVPEVQRSGLPNSTLGSRARAIVLDPADPQRFWVGLEVGGVMSTQNGGESWSCTLPGGNPDIHMMASDPARPGVLYATTGFGRLDNSEPHERRVAGLFRSEDAGRTWEYLWANLEPKYTRPMCVDQRAPHAITVGCSPTAFSTINDAGGAKSMLYQSADGGRSWRSLGDADHSPSAANILAVAPADESSAVLVGTETGEVWRVSSDGGWTLLARDLPAVQSLLAVS